MNIHFIKGQYLWKKKFFNVIRISFRWQRRPPVYKKPHYKFKRKTWKPQGLVKVLKYGAQLGQPQGAGPKICKNYLQQLNSLNDESFFILKTGLSQSNFYKKIVEFHNLKKTGQQSWPANVSDLKGPPNFLFRIHNILKQLGFCPPYEYLIKYQWTQKTGPSAFTKFQNQSRIFCHLHQLPTGPQVFEGGSRTNLGLCPWKICFDQSKAKPQFHKMIIKNQKASKAVPIEAFGPIAKRSTLFPASPLEGELASPLNFFSVFDKKTKGQTKFYLQGPRRGQIYQNIWLQDYEKSNQNTYFLQRPISFPFQWIQKGDLLSDCSSSLKGELALGKNLLVAYMPWEGFNFEDAVLINEKVLSKYTSLHIEKYDIEIAESGLEKITSHTPGISTKNLQKLDPNGVVKIGSWVTEGDILVGRILPIPTETQNLLTHEKLLYDIVVFGQKETQIQERCLRVPQGVSGRIIRISYTHRIKHQQTGPRSGQPLKNDPSKEIFKNPSGEIDKKSPGLRRRGAATAPAFKKELFAQNDQRFQRLLVRFANPNWSASRTPVFVQHLYCYLIGRRPGATRTAPMPSYDFGCPSDLEKKKYFRQKTEKLGLWPAKVPKIRKTVILQKKASVFLRWFRQYESFLKTYFWVIRTKIFAKGGWLRFQAVRAKPQFIKYNNKIFCLNRFLKNDRYQKGLKLAKTQFLLIRTVNLFLLRKNTYTKNWRNLRAKPQKRNFRTVGGVFRFNGFAKPTHQLRRPLVESPLRGPNFISPWRFQMSFKKNQNQFRKQSQTKLFQTKKRNLKNIWRDQDSSSHKAKAQFKPILALGRRRSRWSQRSPDNFETTLPYKKISASPLPKVDAASPLPRGNHLVAAKAQFINSLKKITIYIAEKREFQIGDKISGRHGNKGIISQIFSNSDMPYLSNGCTLDVLLNPLGVPSRMNVGQIFECLLGFTGQIFHTKFQVLCFDEIYGYESSRSFIYSKLFELCKKTRQKWLLSKKTPGKLHLFDGRNGQLFYQSIMVGSTYLMKLIHVVDEKIHARGTGPYSLITQQPLRGRAKHGGQRLGEMEVWALQGFGSAYTLQELLTVKSDDLHGRNQVMHTLLKNTPLRFGTPESLRVVLRELQCLCLDLQLLEKDQSWSAKRTLLNTS